MAFVAIFGFISLCRAFYDPKIHMSLVKLPHSTRNVFNMSLQGPRSGGPSEDRQESKMIDRCRGSKPHKNRNIRAHFIAICGLAGFLTTSIVVGSYGFENRVRAAESPVMSQETVIEQVENVADEVTTYATIISTSPNQVRPVLEVPQSAQSAGWERARQKRTIAVKKMAKEGILKLEQDEEGNQMLSVPWMPNQKLRYKSLSLEQKLQGEIAAGAIGELAKDILLHPIDTLKSRKQAGVEGDEEDYDGEGKGSERSWDDSEKSSENVDSQLQASFTSLLQQVRDLYAGFPAVATSSLPQGGIFFLAKKGGIEVIKRISPSFASSLVGQAIPVGFGSVSYWGVRTPAEILKVKVQLGQSLTVKDAFVDLRAQICDDGIGSLWKFYPALLSLDIPYAIINFALYGIFNDLIAANGIETSVYTRLLSGVACGMIAAAVTCPIDVAKTRIISRGNRLVGVVTDGNEKDPLLCPTRTKSGDESDGIHFMEYSVSSDVATSLDHIHYDQNVMREMVDIVREEGFSSLFIGLKERVLYVGLSNGIRLAAYSTSRMDLMLRSFDTL